MDVRQENRIHVSHAPRRDRSNAPQERNPGPQQRVGDQTDARGL
jgi:hypothetical protein